ncbi:CBO0543 family protein [Paenibacillus silvisoli]|uniref:CBO0543 family protein n=1 Tax=Paenibacillus silvisoli TaxID=3110539 RepID=UPI002804FAAF|nr:CBO0543 family protein [Paenibacillus silvisoli]
MLLEHAILILIWIITIGLVVFTTRRNQIREAAVVFLFKQVLTWLLGLTVVQFKLIEYPVREFPYATRTSFSFEYFIFPAICIVYNLRFPTNKGPFLKLCWILLFPSWMTALEVLLERYTDLIRFIHWQWYWTWITLLITFYLSRRFYLWFFKKDKVVLLT